MPRYDYRCRACGDTFEVNRPMSAASEAAACPAGHDDTIKLLSTVALTNRGGGVSARPARATAPASRPAAGGCCGGGCCS